MSNNKTQYERMMEQVRIGEYWAREKWIMGNYPYNDAINNTPRLTLLTEYLGISIECRDLSISGCLSICTDTGPEGNPYGINRFMLMWDHLFSYTNQDVREEAEKLAMLQWLPTDEDKEATDWVQVNHRSAPTGFFFLEGIDQFKDPVSLKELVRELSWEAFGSPDQSGRIRLYWSQGILNKILEPRMGESVISIKKYPFENNNYQGLISNMVKVLGTWEDGSPLTPSEMRHITVLI